MSKKKETEIHAQFSMKANTHLYILRQFHSQNELLKGTFKVIFVESSHLKRNNQTQRPQTVLVFHQP